LNVEYRLIENPQVAFSQGNLQVGKELVAVELMFVV